MGFWRPRAATITKGFYLFLTKWLYTLCELWMLLLRGSIQFQVEHFMDIKKRNILTQLINYNVVVVVCICIAIEFTASNYYIIEFNQLLCVFVLRIQTNNASRKLSTTLYAFCANDSQRILNTRTETSWQASKLFVSCFFLFVLVKHTIGNRTFHVI